MVESYIAGREGRWGGNEDIIDHKGLRNNTYNPVYTYM